MTSVSQALQNLSYILQHYGWKLSHEEKENIRNTMDTLANMLKHPT